MQITKMHGLGNDFIVYWPKRQNKDFNAMAVELCARRTSAGADGLLLVMPSDTCDARMRIINADGSEAEMCGNGIRCFAKYIYEKGVVKKTEMTIETLAGVIKPRLILKDGNVQAVAVDMGKPLFEPKDIPAVFESDSAVNETLKVEGRSFDIASMNMGVPHTMVFTDEIDLKEVLTYGPQIEKDEHFPKHTNVNFVKVLDKKTIEVSTWERGAGKTMACGTGCCASVVACVMRGLTDREVTVKLEAGDLLIEYCEDETVLMTGPAEMVYEGIYLGSKLWNTTES